MHALRYNHGLLGGHSAQASSRAEYIIERNRSRNASPMARTTANRSRNYMIDPLIAVSSPSLCVADAGYTALILVACGGISTSLSEEKGTT
ncbi:ShlB/FhaC/HecB family hemolysin secretion/activation protein, partial [Morganella morganii]|uniref:ShlB/FhaC/HecB family hemolysin secretion/activation protein n=1 Tax=Morganella morganii TaxID=582 RepID=UPI0031F0B861